MNEEKIAHSITRIKLQPFFDQKFSQPKINIILKTKKIMWTKKNYF